MPNITVKVTTRNVGRATAPVSQTAVVLVGQNNHFQSFPSFQHVHELAPGHSQTNTLTISTVKPHLGPTHMRAVADFDDKLPESNGNNNERTSPMIPAIARTWDAESLTANLIGGQAVTDEQGKANLGLFFRFNHLDVGAGIFVYRVTGSVNENATYSLPPCGGRQRTQSGTRRGAATASSASASASTSTSAWSRPPPTRSPSRSPARVTPRRFRSTCSTSGSGRGPP